MEAIFLLWLALAIIGAYGLYKVYTTKETKIANVSKTVAALPVLAVLVFGLLQMGALGFIHPALGPLAAGLDDANGGEGVGDDTTIPPTECATGMVWDVAQGKCVSAGVVTPKARQLQISTFNVQLKEKYSNSYTSVGDATNGTLKIYDELVNPSDPTANAIVEINVTSGTATKTNPNIVTDKRYRVVLDGGDEWYTKDYGVITFPYTNFNQNTGVYLFDKDSIAKMATISDMLDETDGCDDGTCIGQGYVNAETSATTADSELYNTTTADTLFYNRTTGDGSWYVKPEISISGANRETQKLVWCYDWDTTNPPEGNELTSIVYQHESGTAWTFMPSEQITLWATQSCVQLGDNIKGGTAGRFRITVTQTDGNLDDNDVWSMRLDDLGDFQGKDLMLNIGRPYDSIIIDSTA